MDDDNNSLLSGVDLDSDLSIDPSMLSTPGDRHSATSFQDINDMNMTFTDMIGGASDANMSFLGDGDGPCDVDWSSIQFLHAEDEPSQTSLMFPSQGESSQATTAPTTAMTSFSIPAPSRDTYSSQNSNFADTPAPNTQANTFTTKPIFSVSQQPSANAPHPHQHHQHPHDQQRPPNAATPTPTPAAAPAPAPRQGYKTVWPGWTTANTSNTPCPIFGGPHPPKIYEYRPPTFGPHGNQDQKHPPPPPPADEHGIRTDLTTQEAVADAAKVAFVKGAAWCLTALVRQVNHELKTQGTMFGFKPDKKVRKQEVVRKTVTDYFQNNNPPTLAALACAEEVGRMFGRHYPALFLPIPGAKEPQKQQTQTQRSNNLQNTGAVHGSIPVYMGDGPVPAMYMATIPDTAMASVPASTTTVPSPSTTAPANSQTWQASSQVPSSAPAKSTTSPTSGPAPAIAKQQMRTGKKKDKLYALTGAFREVKHNGEVITTWQCTDNQYRLMDEVYGEAGTAVKSGPAANGPPQAHNASPMSTQTYPHMQTGPTNANPLYMQHHNQQQQPAQGQYIPTSSPATNTSIGHIYTYHGPNKQADPRTYLSPQIQQQQQQSLYVLSPQQGPAASVPKRKRAPDAESAAPLTKRRGKNTVSEAVLSQSRG